MNDFDFVQGWFEKGKDEKEHIFKFVSYFIAFNFLYRQNSRPFHDKLWMENYVKSTVKAFYPDDSVFELLPSDSEYLDSSRIRCLGGSFLDKTTENLFSCIYKVRCNLFHGSKAMDTPRDKGLVREGATVLEDFLTKWLEKNRNDSNFINSATTEDFLVVQITGEENNA